ncbi:dual oxidase maturation factor 1 isoform X2 [Monodelphis domestica]|uniref:dual oxidase maturation factor 1 isoform X2 n=1 Tax=Monodelphis domestica TaxID=13616 RepID=UPI00044339E6|nr:dual oxidase maturation factor 1 isoform X2 [Monodelphis domestica]
MSALGHTFPFYAGPKPTFPMDTTSAVIITVFLTLLVTFIGILPGIRGKMRLFWLLRVVTSLFIGAATLGTPIRQLNETIDYNEQFRWHFGQNYAEEYIEALEKGVPDPVLYLAEKFTPNNPCDLYRQYRLAGHYASATLWVAFLCWLLSNVLLSMPALVYGGHMLLATGAFLIFSLLFFSSATTLTPLCPLRLGSASLHIQRGPAFWITLATGLLCILLGLIVMVMHRIQPDRLKIFFNQSGIEEPEKGAGPEEGGLLSPRYRISQESPGDQDITLSEAPSEECPREGPISPVEDPLREPESCL